ncbi:MAG: peroxide stress protein YaaA [Rhodobacteraceae bacterium]|nr:peroxide stress protein YaaA [Paracoccaceae bacterium]
MLAVLSPAKKLDFSPVAEDIIGTLPEFQEDAGKLARAASRLTISDLRSLMGISQDIARLNKARFRDFADLPDAQNSKQALLAFAGGTYTGLQAARFTADDRAYAQNHLRILSGLYGLLRPLDRIQPYRLEMGSRLKTRNGPHLYAYWGARLAEALDTAADGAPVVCLASQEYFKAANEARMTSPVIHVAFKEERNKKLSMISFFAKRARGAMARYIITERVDQAEGLKDFDRDGYRFRKNLSEHNRLVFSRAAS